MEKDEIENLWNGCMSALATFIGIVAFLILCLLYGCTAVKYVPVTVPEIHTEYIHSTDSVHHTDSVIKEKETTIMQLDSQAMAEYGIRIEKAERAWLVKTKELERELQRIAKIQADTIILCDSIPVPYPYPEYVERQLTWWQRTRIHCGEVLLCIIGVIGMFLIFRVTRKLW